MKTQGVKEQLKVIIPTSKSFEETRDEFLANMGKPEVSENFEMILKN